MYVFYEARTSIDSDSQSAMETVEDDITVTLDTGACFALRVAMHNDSDQAINLRANVCVPLALCRRLWALDSDTGATVLTLPSKTSQFDGPDDEEIVPVRFASYATKCAPGDVKLIDLGVWVNDDTVALPVLTRIEADEWDGEMELAVQTIGLLQPPR